MTTRVYVVSNPRWARDPVRATVADLLEQASEHQPEADPPVLVERRVNGCWEVHQDYPDGSHELVAEEALEQVSPGDPDWLDDDGNPPKAPDYRTASEYWADVAYDRRKHPTDADYEAADFAYDCAREERIFGRK